MSVLFRRPDGSFVIQHPATSYPYHVTADDPLAGLYTAEDVEAAPLEPEPETTPVVTPREPTKAELQAQLDALAARIAALP